MKISEYISEGGMGLETVFDKMNLQTKKKIQQSILFYIKGKRIYEDIDKRYNR